MSRFADDLVASQSPWWTQTQEDYLRAIATMFAQAEDYAIDPDEDDQPTPYVYMPNLVQNPSFEYDASGAAPAAYTSVSPNFPTFLVSMPWADEAARACTSLPTSLGTPVGASFQVVWSGVRSVGTPRSSSPSRRVRTWRLASQIQDQQRQRPVQAGCSVQWFDANGNGLGSGTPGFAAALPAAGGQVDVTQIYGPAPAGTAGDVREAWRSRRPRRARLTLTSTAWACSWTRREWCRPTATAIRLAGDWDSTPGNSMSYAVPPYPQVGWSKMWDVDRADTAGLPWLAQIVGERIPAGMADAQVRQLIRRNPNAYRGTTSAIAHGIMPMLTGTQSVFTRERAKLDGTTPNGWLAVQTYATETPT